jgi:hypothetical protein
MVPTIGALPLSKVAESHTNVGSHCSRVTTSEDGPMEAPWKAGDTASAHCPHCGDLVTAKYARRSLFMPRTRLKVRDVLVSICGSCDAMLTLPRQSMAQLREVGIGK